jgi:hypothetical protein
MKNLINKIYLSIDDRKVTIFVIGAEIGFILALISHQR